MKKFLLSAGVILATFATNAQVVITQADFAVIGDVVYVGRDTVLPTLNLGAAASGQTWVFSDLTVDEVETLNFIDPASLPDAAAFPTANISFPQLGADAYIDKSASGVKVLGVAGNLEGAPFPVVADFNPTQDIIRFPAQIGLTYADTSQIDETLDITAVGQGFVDSARVKRTFYTNHNFDADGSLTIPLGTYQVVRDRVVQTTIDSIWVYAANANIAFGIQQGWQLLPGIVAGFVGLDGAVTTETTYNYRFFGTNAKYYVADISTDANGAPSSMRYQADPATLSTKEDIYTNNNVQLFPNPTSGLVNVFVKDLKGEATLTIFDATGRTVSSNMLTASQNTISVSGLTAGAYMYRVANEQGAIIKTGKLLIAE
ncbi:MAG: T9SS type A sorting domain-containing protein [Sphingobacteriales bacterium JAD_PAG50586_3]|nr:MAG: T9SS type A sorting domain-containing protein [Sphingobacteriales bacterium JAD_PAG50586_3]